MGTDGCVEEHEHHRGKIKTQKEISCKVDAENKLLTEIVWVSGSRSSNIQRLLTAAEWIPAVWYSRIFAATGQMDYPWIIPANKSCAPYACANFGTPWFLRNKNYSRVVRNLRTCRLSGLQKSFTCIITTTQSTYATCVRQLETPWYQWTHITRGQRHCRWIISWLRCFHISLSLVLYLSWALKFEHTQ